VKQQDVIEFHHALKARGYKPGQVCSLRPSPAALRVGAELALEVRLLGEGTRQHLPGFLGQ